MQNERPTITVELPMTKAKVTLFTYLLNKDFKEVKIKALKGASVDVSGKDVEIKAFDASVTVEMQDLTLKRMIKSFGFPGEDIQYTPEQIDTFVDNLPQKDGDFLLSQVEEATKESFLSSEAKKK